MNQAKIFLLAGGLGLLAVMPAGARFHQMYGRSYQFGELTSVASTQAPGAIASGYFIDASPQGALLKVLPTGNLAWARAYGPTFLAAVRETPAHGFAWIGTGSLVRAGDFTPVVAGVDPLGTVLWARRIRLVLPDGTPANQAYGSYLEIDPKDGGYWVGGEVWLHAFDDPQPWLGKLDSAGNLLWAKTLGFSANARFYSIFPAYDGGIIGVGEIWAEDNPSRNRALMLAVKLGAGGKLVWGAQYHVRNTEADSEQRLSDLDRDPLYERAESVVVGTIDAFCKNVPSAPCNSVESAALVGTLDETTGQLSKALGLFSTSRPKTLGETIVMDLRGETVAVGGEIAGDEAGSREGFLALLSPDLLVVRRAATHGASAGFDARVRSLDRWRDGNSRGYLFAVNGTRTVGIVPAWLRSLVRTDRDGSSGGCEQCTGLEIFETWIDQSGVQPELYAGTMEAFPLEAAPLTLVEEPCDARPCSEPVSAPGRR